MLIPLGFWAASAGGGAASSFDLLETQVLSSSAASVTFSGLSTYAADYQHLQIRFTARTDRAATTDSVIVRFNSDSASDYSRHGLTGENFTNTVTSFGVANETFAGNYSTAGASAGTNVFGAGVIDILDPFESTKFKTVRGLSGTTGGNSVIQLASGSWRSLTAVSSITLDQQLSSNFITGSRFSLYGIRGG